MRHDDETPRRANRTTGHRLRFTDCASTDRSSSAGSARRPLVHPLTQTTCFSFATTSTRSRCWSMTCSIGL